MYTLLTDDDGGLGRRNWILSNVVPGGMGVAFMKQWAAAGAGKSVKLYPCFTVDDLTLKPVGKAAVGTCQMMHRGPTWTIHGTPSSCATSLQSTTGRQACGMSRHRMARA